MPLKLSASSGGSVTLEPTNTASNYTLTVPAQTATLAINGPAFTAYVASTQSISPTTFTKVNFDTAPSWGTATNSWDAVNKRFTAPVSGYYLITGEVYSTAGSGWGNQTLTLIYVNGGTDVRTQDTASSTYNLQTNALIYLSAGQYLEIYIYASGGGNVSGGSSLSWVRGVLVRAA